MRPTAKSCCPSRIAEIRRLLRRVKNSGADSLALCFLFAFANPAHERRVAAALKSLGLPLSISHEILPEFREFERLSTVVINAYLAPRMGTYLRNLENRMRAAGTLHGVRLRHKRIYVMQSNGGISTAGARGAAARSHHSFRTGGRRGGFRMAREANRLRARHHF